MDKSILGRSDTVTQEVILQSGGMWKANMIVTHKQTKDGTNWETKAAQMGSYATTPEAAQALVVHSMSAYLVTVQFDLFNEPEGLNVKDNSPKN